MGRRTKTDGESGLSEIITDANGDGSLAVVFENPMDSVFYTVNVTPQEEDITANPYVKTKTAKGFTIGVDNSDVVSTEVIDASSVALTFNDNTQETIVTSGETVTFAEVGATGDTITRATGGFSRYLTDGDEITIAGSTSNDGTYTIATVTDTVITMGTDDLAAEVATTVSITITPTVPLKADTVVRASGSWVTIFTAGEVITVSDDGSDINAGSYTITLISTVTMTLTLTTDSVVQEANTTDTFTVVSDNGAELGWIAQQNKH